MEGQAVTIGSSISTTGSMLVYCNKPYVLKVDDVVWSPIGTSDGDDEYVLSTSGLIEIYVGKERIFFFRNMLEEDFSIRQIETRFYQDSTQIGAALFDQNTYAQRIIPENANKIGVGISGTIGGVTMTGAEIEELGITASQGNVEIAYSQSNLLFVRILDIDPSSYCLVRAGNVLVGFYLPS